MKKMIALSLGLLSLPLKGIAMRFSHTNLIVALLAMGIAHADPVLFIKNNSKRPVYVEPLDDIQLSMTQHAKLIKAKGEYIVENLNPSSIGGVAITYCKAGVSCSTESDIRANGIEEIFEFHDPQATKFYLKLDIDTNDKITLKTQEGRLGRTSNLKWSLDGNIVQNAITRPSTKMVTPPVAKPAAPPVPANLYVQTPKPGPSTPLAATPITPSAGDDVIYVQKPSALPTDIPPALPQSKSPQGQSESEFSDEAWAQFPEADALRKKGANLEGNNSEALARAVLNFYDTSIDPFGNPVKNPYEWSKLHSQRTELLNKRREEVIKDKNSLTPKVKNEIKDIVKDAYEALENILSHK
jgi:hypothetical protein